MGRIFFLQFNEGSVLSGGIENLLCSSASGGFQIQFFQFSAKLLPPSCVQSVASSLLTSKAARENGARTQKRFQTGKHTKSAKTGRYDWLVFVATLVRTRQR
jgi:Na+/H+ antiporter NhaD/arsenite permease-like protein